MQGSLKEVFFLCSESQHDEAMHDVLSRLARERLHVHTFQNLEQLKQALKEKSCHVLLLFLSQEKDKQILEELKVIKPNAAMVVITKNVSLSRDQELLSHGVQDVLYREELTPSLLERSLVYSCERKRNENYLEEYSLLITHELRAPLAVVKGAVEALLSENFGALNEKQLKMVQLANRNSSRLSRVVENILDLTRFETGKVQFQVEEIDLWPLIEETVLSFQSQAREKNITILEDVSLGLPKAKADTTLIMHVFYNLVSNALRFAKSKILIKASLPNEEITNRHAIDATQHYVQITVSDDGCGMKKEEQERLFQELPFSHTSPKDKRYSGAGLGLNLCYRILRLLNGCVWVESEPQKGAHFHFLLPATDIFGDEDL